MKKKAKEPTPIPTKVSGRTLFPMYVLRHDKAEDKAAQLLWDHLSDEQKLEIMSYGGRLTLKSGGFSLRIHLASPHAAELKGPVGFYHSVCIQPINRTSFPLGDSVLTKKLAFEANPKKFACTCIPRYPW